MWKKFIIDYLSFSKKDRIGVLVLVCLIFLVVLLPYIWPAKKLVPPSKQEIEKIKSLAAQLNTPDSGRRTKDEDAPDVYPARNYYNKQKAAAFYFDPNTLSPEGWQRLGIRDRTITTIQNFLGKGGKFRKPEDIGKIYGLFKDDYARLLPYVQIKDQQGFEKKDVYEKKEYAAPDNPLYIKKSIPAPRVIEINSADTTAFIALPGIGSKLAARIVNFRDRLGGFYAVQQVAETFGLPDSTFIKIKPLLQCNPQSVQQININTADANALKQHPYIRWNLANAIVQYRNQHGNFKEVEDLLKIAVVTPEIFEKIKRYLIVE